MWVGTAPVGTLFVNSLGDLSDFRSLVTLATADKPIGPADLARKGGGSMVNVYAAPRLVSLPAAPASVENEIQIAILVAAVLGIAVLIVLSVCNFCGTLGSYWACYWTMVTWLWGWWC